MKSLMKKDFRISLAVLPGRFRIIWVLVCRLRQVLLFLCFWDIGQTVKLGTSPLLFLGRSCGRHGWHGSSSHEGRAGSKQKKIEQLRLCLLLIKKEAVDMKPLFEFFIKLCILSVILWGVIFSALRSASVDYHSVFLAWIMVVVNTVAGYLLFEYAFDKESAVFTKVVFGGLTVRLLLLMVLVAVVIIRNMAVINDFVFSFFAFYCIYVIVEILGYQKKNKQKKNTA